MDPFVIPPKPPAGTPGAPSARARSETASETAARATAEAFEATFLAEMLKQTGINRTPEAIGGGAGEDAFASFLTGEYARLVAERGGIGLAEAIFHGINPKGPGA